MKNNRGFTLIELLVVIAIIGILSAVVLSALTTAKLKGSDAQTEESFHSLQTALENYYLSNGHMPPNVTPGVGDCSSPLASLSPLVTGHFISKIPTSPNPNYPYCYYDYGTGTTPGAILVSQLQAAPSTSSGYPGTCRPFGIGTNWCDQSNSTWYCVCDLY